MPRLTRIASVIALAFRASLVGGWAIAYAAIAAIPSIVVLALAGAHTAPALVESRAEGLFTLLTIRVVIVLVTLLLYIAPFRDEIEADTLTYLSGRSIPTPEIALGKYLGASAAAAIFLLPGALLPLAFAGAAGAPAPPSAVPESIALTTLLAMFAYGAIFLLFGLLSRSALLIGLLYGFLWEQLISLLPGEFPKLTILYYLRSYLSDSIANGPLSHISPSASASVALGVPLAVGIVGVALTALLFRTVETAPQRTSA